MSYIPSVCHIRVEVKGRRAELEEFRKSVSGFEPVLKGNSIITELSEFCFNAVIPISEDFIVQQSLTVLSKLRVGLWGTDARAINVRLRQGPHSLAYTFAVFEVPPLPVLLKVISGNKNLKFKIEYENHQTGVSGLILGRSGRGYQRQFEKYRHERSA